MADNDDLARRVAVLEDVRAIEQLKFEYAAFCDDNYNPQGIAGIFTEDGEWIVDGEGATLSGRQAIIDHFAALSGKITWAQHYMLNPEVQIDPSGETATGKFRLLCLCTIEQTADPNAHDAVILTLDYRDKFVKVDGKWFFTELIGRTHQVSNWDQGWVKQQFRP